MGSVPYEQERQWQNALSDASLRYRQAKKAEKRRSSFETPSSTTHSLSQTPSTASPRVSADLMSTPHRTPGGASLTSLPRSQALIEKDALSSSTLEVAPPLAPDVYDLCRLVCSAASCFLPLPDHRQAVLRLAYRFLQFILLTAAEGFFAFCNNNNLLNAF